ncbi:hypothetical protein TNIN_12511 [Trichonephila inaurata madagascariensis]|uniref:Uncharacterized protein n=1 Tax=Trichonephila inaurata madagascariensis TaxID=2747483 RepID=A0A8X6YRW3_9ARAC|nr:hypothetical protein TNIN_12511 [Trichonephila inaurata madagascariensis]
MQIEESLAVTGWDKFWNSKSDNSDAKEEAIMKFGSMWLQIPTVREYTTGCVWVLEPSTNSDTAESPNSNEELGEPTSNELKVTFRNLYQELSFQYQYQLYPGLWAKVQDFFITFFSPFLAERESCNCVAITIPTHAILYMQFFKMNRIRIIDRDDLRLI